MEKIKIGNSIAVTWKITMASAAGEQYLDKEQMKLYLRNDYEVKEITTFSLEDNVVCFVFDKDSQKYTGVYTLVLFDLKDGKRAICEDNAFELVVHSSLEKNSYIVPDEKGNYPVLLRSNVLTVKSVANDAALYARLVALEEKATSLEAKDTAIKEELDGYVTLLKTFIANNSHTDAFKEDYLEVADFAKCCCVEGLTGTERYQTVMQMLNKWLGNIKFNEKTDQIYMGRCKLHVDGADIENYNFVTEWAAHKGVQMVFGPVDTDDDGNIIVVDTFKILCRKYANGEWTAWKEYGGLDLEEITPEEIDAMWEEIEWNHE